MRLGILLVVLCLGWGAQIWSQAKGPHIPSGAGGNCVARDPHTAVLSSMAVPCEEAQVTWLGKIIVGKVYNGIMPMYGCGPEGCIEDYAYPEYELGLHPNGTVMWRTVTK